MAAPINFFGSEEPVHIFQDDLYDTGASLPMPSQAPMPAYSNQQRRPLSNASSNVALNPPANFSSTYSPHKAKSSSPRSPLKPSHNSRLNAVPMAPPPGKTPLTDSLNKKPHLSNFKTASQKQNFDLSLLGYGNENMFPQIHPAPPINFGVDTSYQKPNGKRVLLEAAPISESRPVKKTKTDDQALPPHDSFPPIIDTGKKPTLSYAQLIGMAILRSPMRRLTLSQIYKWISDNYSFYGPTDAGWQNSIRHNLSLHKSFVKIERPKDDPGKGNYWAIAPGQEHQYLREKPTKKAAPTAENLPVMSTRLEPSRPSTAPTPVLAHERIVSQPPPATQPSLPPLPSSQPLISTQGEPSSDATIPVSDSAAPDENGDKHGDSELPHESLYSPLPAAMHSSPPAPRQMTSRSGTPPPMMHQPTSSVPRARKRKSASMDDSGYISSLESSAMRPNQKSLLLTSEADRPRFRKRPCGRAEEEIARLRNSSPYSPTKGRSHTSYGPISSSPLRQAQDRQMLPPLTPKSPLHRVAGLGEECVPWSPAFKLDDALYNFDEEGVSTDFDIFQDMPNLDDNIFAGLGPIDNQSPVKRSAKRARLDRSVSTSVLDDVTNSATKKPITSAPLLKAPEQQPMTFFDTPSKAFEGLSSPSKLFQDSPIRGNSPTKFSSFLQGADADWSNLMMDSNGFTGAGAGTAESGGLDILQGFQKIGSGTQPSRRNKPGMTRSSTTNF
ncbi:hypothetical protein B0I35DRAFT_404447 [Stachybotrys elegans]|uniref:Fork-head domain-containing protein n=1 Tax=Stachybotrys elegans TaxID=80388 RepID=A0A8K0T2W7_9HYPO|nr:hypothetical protein B0I35DRAFT_404447 [Stachybotrys elegans]